MEINIFEHKIVYPFAKYGFIGSFWGLNVSTLFYTWIVVGIILLIGGLIKFAANSKNKKNFLLPAKELIDFFQKNIEENIGHFDKSSFEFVLSIFFFILLCNIIGVLPFLEEPTTDINTCLAIGVTCFLFVQFKGLQAKGLGYFKKFFTPVFILFPLNIIGQTSKIISLSFRLFGNILAGAIILSLLKMCIKSFAFYYVVLNLMALAILYLDAKFKLSEKNILFSNLQTISTYVFFFIPVLQIFFGIFEGTIQALVVSLLTSMYIANEMSSESEH